MGKYHMFGRAFPLGGMMNKPPEMAQVPPHWGIYFRVADVHAGAERVKANGGQVLNGPMEVPGGDWIVNCMDPQGAAFSLHHRKSSLRGPRVSRSAGPRVGGPSLARSRRIISWLVTSCTSRRSTLLRLVPRPPRRSARWSSGTRAQAPELAQGYGPELALTSRQLLQLAEATPAEKFALAPAGGRAIDQRGLHAPRARQLLPARTGRREDRLRHRQARQDPEKSVTEKADVIRLLRESLDAVASRYKTADRQKQVQIFNREAVADGVFLRILLHNNEHMGQSIAYARMNGIVPPWSNSGGICRLPKLPTLPRLPTFIIGDIPVDWRPVTPATIITTIDQGDQLEAYINVPLEQATRLRPGLTVELLDPTGEVIASNPVTFIAPRADDATQSVLAKATLRQSPPSIRVMQYVRARIIWNNEPSLVVPARRGEPHRRTVFRPRRRRERKGAIARQRPVSLGEVIGEDYIVRSGLKPGEKVIVSNLQKISDGRPLNRAESRGLADSPMFVDTFIRRPILATVCSLVIVLAGALAIPSMPVAQYPDVAPPTVSVTSVYTGANAETVETAVTTPLEQAINGVEGMMYMSSSSTNSGVSQITVTFDVTRNPDLAAVDVQNRVNQALGRLPAEVRQLGVTVQKSASNFVLAAGVGTSRRPVRLAVHLQLPRRLRQGRAEARAGRRRRDDLR